MRNFLLFVCGCCLVAANLAAATIQYQVTPLPGAGQFRYSYTVSGITFQPNEELDIQFPAATSSALTNGVAGAGFLLQLFQPNNPPGVQGDYSALATVNNPSLAGPFRVDFTYLATGQPGSQPYLINQFDANGNFLNTVTSGVTIPLVSGVPEPGSIALVLLGLMAGGAVWAARYRRSGMVQ